MLENGAVYQGEWLVNENQKDGRGVQIWPDGSRYDGFWRDGMANGYGRLVHAEGDVYDPSRRYRVTRVNMSNGQQVNVGDLLFVVAPV